MAASPEQVSVIIPTQKETVKTTDSLPDEITEVCIVREGNRSEARNLGVRRTTNPLLVFLDDDISFTEQFFWTQLARSERGTVTGLRDYTFNLLLTRFLVVHRDDFVSLGGFDESLNHLEDTEFSVRARAAGLTLQHIPRSHVYHHEQDIRKDPSATIRGMVYICQKFPTVIPFLLARSLRRVFDLGVRESLYRVSDRK